MHNSLVVFKQNIKSASEIGSLYDYLKTNVASMSFDDLLRSQIVYSVSAFDKLMHDVVRIGMVDIFIGKRPPTPKYLNDRISLKTHYSLISATLPPKEFHFEQHVVSMLSWIAYQDPDKVVDGLSYIWDNEHKWQTIAAAMGSNANSVKRNLRLIVDRRNFIVHEADIDYTTGLKRTITKADCESSISFLNECGATIVKLVTQ